MKKAWLLLLIGAGVLGVVYNLKILQKNTPALEIASQNTQPTATGTDAAKEAVGKPKTFSIPKLNIVSLVEEVGAAEDGRMGVPKTSSTVGWWKLGVKPGETGSAVVAGHLDTPEGTPGVFSDLDSLELGDRIAITDSLDNTYTFEVVDKQIFKDASFPLQKVFASDDGKNLNLITCWGSWDNNAKNYDERLVVFAKMTS